MNCFYNGKRPLALDSSHSWVKTLNIPGITQRLPVDTDGFTYGYVFSRQKADKEVRRGYLQKSLVILSPHPWVGLFLKLVSVMGPHVMASLVADRKTGSDDELNRNAVSLLEAAVLNISSWPSPLSSISPESYYCPVDVELPFFGIVHTFSFPPNNVFPQVFPLAKNGISSSSQINCSPGSFFEVFSNCIESLWMCWELMMLSEPILVMANTPKGCSDVAWALIELMKPIPFGGDFRPYLTIQDTDFKLLTNRARPVPPGTVVGVTNLVFGSFLDHFPNFVKVSRYSDGSSSTTLKRNGSKANTRPIGLEEDSAIEAVTSKHRRFLSKDKRLLKDVFEARAQGKSHAFINNMIRRHFVELSDRFLQPLNRHFDGLMIDNPQQMSLSTLKSRPDIKPFKQESFLRQIEQSKPSLPLSAKRPISDMYRMFLKTPNFAAWLNKRTVDAEREWRLRYLDVLCFSSIEKWKSVAIRDESDVECIDLIMRLRDEMTKHSKYFIKEPSGQFVYTSTTRIFNVTRSTSSRSIKDLNNGSDVSLPFFKNNPDTMGPAVAANIERARTPPPLETMSQTSGQSGAALTHNRFQSELSPLNSSADASMGKLSLSTRMGSIAGSLSDAESNDTEFPLGVVTPSPQLGSGEFIVTAEQYNAMQSQLDALLAILPNDLKVSILKKK